MSDAISDIARDEARNQSIALYFDRVRDYLKKPTPKNLKKAVEAAKHADSIPDGYFGGQTSLAKGAKKNLKNLLFWVQCGIVETKSAQK